MQVTIFFISSIIFILIFIWFVSFIIAKNEKLLSGIYRGRLILTCIILGYSVWTISLLCNDIVQTLIPVQIFAVILFLFPPIVSIAFGMLLQKLIQKSFKAKYDINLFPLFLILLCLFILALTLFVMKNTNYNNQIETTLALSIGLFLASLAFSGKVISKYDDKIEKKVK